MSQIKNKKKKMEENVAKKLREQKNENYIGARAINCRLETIFYYFILFFYD